MGAYKQIYPLSLYNTMKFLFFAVAGLQPATGVRNACNRPVRPCRRRATDKTVLFEKRDFSE